MSSEKWYYVRGSERQGPVNKEIILQMIMSKELNDDDYVWKKGFETWRKIGELGELKVLANLPEEPVIHDSRKSSPQSEALDKIDIQNSQVFLLKDLKTPKRNLYICIGDDRGEATTEYGPFTFAQIEQLYQENRINSKTFLYSKGAEDWKRLAEYADFSEIFGEEAILIDERRAARRRPFIARLFVNNNKSFYEGICRDISIGGMQVLVDEFAGLAGDRISINVHPENSDYHFVASGIVVRILEGQSGFSFRFENLSLEAKEAIEKYLKDFEL